MEAVVREGQSVRRQAHLRRACARRRRNACCEGATILAGPGSGVAFNRYYDPNTAQFLSVDPLVNITGRPYSFVGDNPLGGTDPTGLMVMGCGPDGTSACSCVDLGTCGPSTSPTQQQSGTGGEGVSSFQDNSGGSWGAATLGGAAGAVSGSDKASENVVRRAAEQAAEGSAERSSLEGLAANIAQVGRAFDGFNGALSVTVDYANHVSVGRIAGDAIGGELGTFTGGTIGGVVCSESGPGAATCVIGLSAVFGAGGAVAGGWLGEQAESGGKALVHWIKSW